MNEKKSYPYLRSLMRCGLSAGAVISAIIIALVVLIIWPSGNWLFLKIFGNSLSSVLFASGFFLSLITLYSATLPRHVPAYLSTRKMMHYYQKTGSGVRLFNKMLMFGTDAEPMACLFVAGLFMILEGVIIHIIWG